MTRRTTIRTLNSLSMISRTYLKSWEVDVLNWSSYMHAPIHFLFTILRSSSIDLMQLIPRRGLILRHPFPRFVYHWCRIRSFTTRVSRVFQIAVNVHFGNFDKRNHDRCSQKKTSVYVKNHFQHGEDILFWMYFKCDYLTARAPVSLQKITKASTLFEFARSFIQLHHGYNRTIETILLRT